VYVSRNIQAQQSNDICRAKKTVINIYSECVYVALVNQHATRMRHIFICVVHLGPPYFPTLSHKRHDFRKNVYQHKMCALVFSINLYEIFILRRLQRDMITIVHWSSCKVPVILVLVFM
jgi:hypothetical protein